MRSGSNAAERDSGGKGQFPREFPNGPSCPTASSQDSVHSGLAAVGAKHATEAQPKSGPDQIDSDSLYDSAPVADVSVDAEGRIQSINLAAAALLGGERSQLLGIPLQSFLVPADRAALTEHGARVANSAGPQTARFNLQVLGRESAPVRFHSVTQGGRAQGRAGFRSQLVPLDMPARDGATLEGGALDRLDIGIAVLDPEANIRWVNPAWENVGRQLQSIPALCCGLNYFAACRSTPGAAGPGSGEVMIGIQAVLAGRQIRSVHEYPGTIGPEEHWFEMTVTRLPLPLAGVLLSQVDITQRHCLEVALREQEESFWSLVKGLPDGVLITQNDCIIFINPPGLRLLGFPDPAPVLGLSPLAVFPPEWHPLVRARAADLLPQGSVPPIERTLLRPDGRELSVEVAAMAFQLAGEPAVKFRFRDISDHRCAAERLTASEQRERERAAELAALLDAIPAPVFIAHDQECRHITGNRAADELIRLPPGSEASLSAPDELRPHHFRVFRNGRELAAGELPTQLAARGEMVREHENQIVFDDGTTRDTVAYATPVRNEAGLVRGAISVMIDITRRKQVEAALVQQSELLTQTQAIAQVGSYEFVPGNRRRSRWSVQMFHILGLDPTQPPPTAQEYWQHFVILNDQQRVQHAVETAIQKRQSFALDYRIRRQDGAVRHVQSVAECHPGTAPEEVRFVGFLQDITDRKFMEKELLEISEREQNRIGQDLHDGLCQDLTALEFRLFLLKQKVAAHSAEHEAEFAELAFSLRSGIEMSRSLARGLSPAILSHTDLPTALQELAARTGELYRIACHCQCPATVTLTDTMVGIHLYRIAAEAVSNGVRHGHAKNIQIQLVLKPDRLELSVQDDGTGFPQPPQQTNGMGLRVMQHRASLIHATWEVQAPPVGGVRIVCSRPLNQSPTTP